MTDVLPMDVLLILVAAAGLIVRGEAEAEAADDGRVVVGDCSENAVLLLPCLCPSLCPCTCSCIGRIADGDAVDDAVEDALMVDGVCVYTYRCPCDNVIAVAAR